MNLREYTPPSIPQTVSYSPIEDYAVDLYEERGAYWCDSTDDTVAYPEPWYGGRKTPIVQGILLALACSCLGIAIIISRGVSCVY